MYTYIIFLKLFSIIGFYKILTIVPCGRFQHPPVNGCSTASCDFGALAGRNKHLSFYSTILNRKPRGVKLSICNTVGSPELVGPSTVTSEMEVLPSSALPSLLWLLCSLSQGGCYASSHHFQFPGRNKKGVG